MNLNRRQFTKGLGLILGAAAIPIRSPANTRPDFTLRAAQSANSIYKKEKSEVLTNLWTFNQKTPGPTLRFNVGDRAKVSLDNKLPQETSIHWHGVRVKNSMDGVVGLTQPGVKKGEQFLYDFEIPDAGTYWYHSHNKAWEQVARGLYGPLIVNGPEDPKVDHDLVLMIDDWQLDGVGQIREQTFGSLHDWAHAGRIGNWVTVNGMPSPSYRLKDNSRVRLRLINAANARVFDLNFTNVKPRTIALDGYPVDPFESPDLTIGPSQRVDVILDLSDKLPEFALQIITRTTPITIARFLLDKSLGQGGGALNEELITPIRPQPPDASSTSLKIPVHMQGGAMGNLKSANLNGIMTPLRDLAQKHRKVWAFNGSVGGYDHMLGTARRGQFVILDIQNDTRWPHAMHLHGHHFWINSRLNPVKDPLSKRDTYLMQPGENAEFQFVADNPGLWLFHCHMLEHHAAGMGAVIEVT